jgi:HlyD family secretion protein
MTAPDLSKLRIDRSVPSGGDPAARRRWVRRGLILVVAVAVIFVVASRFAAPPAVQTVTVASAWPSQNYTLLNASGYVVPQRNAALSSKAQGRLEWLGVLEGSKVKQNEVIARVESRDVRASMEQAVAQVNVARANLEQSQAELRDAEGALKRSAELLEKKFIAGSQHDTAVARAEKARAAVSSSRATIASAEANRRVTEVAVEQTLIRAPFDGVVLTKNANVGDNITPFSSAANSKGAVVTIADMNTLEVEADVSESSIAKITVGQPVEIQLDALADLRLQGTVSRIVPTVDRTKATVLVKVKFTDRDTRVLPDMSAKVAFLAKPVPPDERKPVTAVQPGAIVERDGKKWMFVVKDDAVKAVEVTVGAKVGELVQVSGVSPGDKAVLKTGDKTRDGAKVTMVKK